MEWLEEKIKQARISEGKIESIVCNRLKINRDCIKPETKLTESEINLILCEIEMEFNIKVDLDGVQTSTYDCLHDVLAKLILMNPYSYSVQD